MSEQPEPKPEGEGGPKGEPINIKVASSDGTDVHFKIKTTTKFSKLKSAYAQRVGKSVSTIRFLFDGTAVGDDDTPASLSMEDQDSIDVMIEQIGGCRRPSL
ncbi:Ubiquitin-like proteins [Phaffia rhodozyma]|uniref:Ubiquitin-like proteins n=1 Tax=Phaffia rhodozyma TaxID=264483 RepID=A0A0F7SFC6_PHARH|nr:Ubiquitin-like proteins [Phaffia rhodozyma]